MFGVPELCRRERVVVKLVARLLLRSSRGCKFRIVKGGERAVIFEKGYNMFDSLRDLPRHLNSKTIGTGFVSSMYAIMGPSLIVIAAAKQGNLPLPLAISWLFAIHVFGGLTTWMLSLYYRQPIVTAYTIPGTVLIGSALTHMPFSEAVGAYVMTGIIVVILGATGIIRKLVERIPTPVMLGMVCGVMISFGVNMVTAAVHSPKIAGIACVVFFAMMAASALRDRIPPILGALVIGVVAATVLGQAHWSKISLSLATPQLTMPTFTLRAFLELTLPLVMLVIGVQNIQAIGVLMAQGYKPPLNAIFTVSGLGTLLNSLFGGAPCVIAGPSTAICSNESAGPKEGRYAASITDGTIWILFGLAAGTAMTAADALPKDLMSVLGGLAMFGVFVSTFPLAFGGRFRAGAMTAFLVAMSNITILKIGAAFWALVIGVLVSVLVDREDFLRVWKGRNETVESESGLTALAE